MSKIVYPPKVAKIVRLIDQQILLRVTQLATFVELKKSIERRMFNGQLREEDLAYIKDQLKQMYVVSLTEQETDHGQDNAQTT